MIRLLHISDVHLGAPLSGFGEAARDRRRAVRDAFRALPARADEWEVDAVLVAGDLFDGPEPEPRDVDLAREVLRSLGAARPVFAIPGNHDPATGRDSAWHAMPPGVTTFLEPRLGPPVVAELADGTALHVYGCAHDPAVEPDPLRGWRRADGEGLHVVLLHAATTDNPEWSGGRSLRVTRPELERLGADYLALGDYHAHRPPDEFGGIPACYAGSFAAVAVDEVGPRGCVVVELAPGAPPRVSLKETPVPALLDLGSIDVSAATNEREVEELIGARARGAPCHPVAALSGEPAFPLDADRVREALRERFGFCVVRDDTRFIDSRRIARLCEQPTVSGHVARLGRERVKSAGDEASRDVAARALRLALRALEVP